MPKKKRGMGGKGKDNRLIKKLSSCNDLSQIRPFDRCVAFSKKKRKGKKKRFVTTHSDEREECKDWKFSLFDHS